MSYHRYADNTQLFLSFPQSSSNTNVTMRVSECLEDISAWTAAHHLKLRLNKTEPLFVPGKDCLLIDLSVIVADVMVLALLTGRNLDVNLDDRLSCAPNITAVAQSCRFAIYNIHRLQSFLTKDVTWLDSQPATLPLQHIRNVTACRVFNLPSFSHVTPFLRYLHWLPVAAHIGFKTMALAVKAINSTAPVYLQTLVRPHAPARARHSTTSAGRWYRHH